jgi:hypothetical protein
MRKLTLDREALSVLGPGDLRAVAAGAGVTSPVQQCLSTFVGCDTADTWCELTHGC